MPPTARRQQPNLLPMSRTTGRTLIAVSALVTLFTLLIAAPTLLRYFSGCLNNYDLGIYAQALQRTSWATLNPWLSVREIALYNDHWDPVVTLLAPLARGLTWMTGQPAAAVLIIELVALLLAGAMLWRWSGSWVLTVAVLFGKAVTDAVGFPGHPTTWCLIAWISFGYSLARWDQSSNQSRTPIVWSAILLLLFKEENLFSVFGAGVALTGISLLGKSAKPPYRTGVGLIVLATVWALWVFWLRELVLGPVMKYETLYWKDANALLAHIFTPRPWITLALLFLPIVPLFLPFSEKKNSKKDRSTLDQDKSLNPACWNWTTIALAAAILGPLLAIRLITDKWGQHYGIALVGPLAGILAASLRARLYDCPVNPFFPISRITKPEALAITLLLGTQLSYLGKTWARTVFRGQDINHCPVSTQRSEEIVKLRESLISAVSKAGGPPTVIASGRVIPQILGTLPDADVRHLGLNSVQNRGQFYLLEKGDERDGFGISGPNEADFLIWIQSQEASGRLRMFFNSEHFIGYAADPT